MYSTAMLMLANGHIRDLYDDANREHLANLVRSTQPDRHRPSRFSVRRLNPAPRILRVISVMSRAAAR